jgi:hypothetical protein
MFVVAVVLVMAAVVMFVVAVVLIVAAVVMAVGALGACQHPVPKVIPQGALVVQQRHGFGIAGHVAQCVGQPRGQLVTHPEHHIGLLKGGGLGRAQGVIVRRGAPLDDRLGLGHAGHDLGDQRLHRRDVGGHPRGGGCGQRDRPQGQAEHGGKGAREGGWGAAFHEKLSFATKSCNAIL